MFNLEDPHLIQINALKPHTWFLPFPSPDSPIPYTPEDTDRAISLNGIWNFRFFTSPTQVPEDIATGIMEADEITVPGCWELSGYDRPQYVNVLYPFPVEPPHVPNEIQPAFTNGLSPFLRIGAPMPFISPSLA